MLNFDTKTGEIFLYGVVGPAECGYIDDMSVINALKAIGNKRVTLRINTPGGNVDVAAAIFTALKKHKAGVDTAVDSLAASAGSYLMLAGEKRFVSSNSLVMIHRAATFTGGTAPMLRKAADDLEKYEQRVIPEYAAASKKTPEQIMEIMEAETYYLAHESLEHGWATEIEGDSGVEPIVTGLKEITNHAPEWLFKKREAVRAELSSPHRFPRLAAAKEMAAKLREAVK